MAVHRAPEATGRGRKLVLIVVPPLVLLAGLAGILLFNPEQPTASLDADLCPIDLGEAPRAVFLVDLRKPLGATGVGLAVDALRDVTVSLAANTELNVFTLADNSMAPRNFVRRVCKPYDNAALMVESAKDVVPGVRDCDELPAQLAAQQRERASRFCAIRDEIAADLERLAARPLAAPVPNAYLVEAIEETSLAFQDVGGKRSFHIFSDMLQHAPWYSHVERGAEGWSFRDFVYQRELAAESAGPRPPALDDVDVTVFYVPRQELTAPPRARMTHTAFWKQFFANALGREPAIHEQPPLERYAVEPLMDKTTEAEQLALERQRLELERKRLQEQQAEVDRSRARAEEAQKRLEEARLEQEREEAENAAREDARQQSGAASPQTPDLATANAGEAEQTNPDAAEQTLAQTPAAEREAAPQPPSQPVAAPNIPAPPPPDATPEATAVEVPPQSEAAAPEVPPPSAEILPMPPREGQATESAAQLASCMATLKSQFKAIAYPLNRRLNMGGADIVLEFEIDEQGATIDDSVQVITEDSAVEQASYMNMFTNQATRAVQAWEFEFSTPQNDPCARRQTRRARIAFEY